MPLNFNLQVQFISKLELSPLTQRFEMQVSWLCRSHWRERILCEISKEDCVTGFSQHYFRNVVEWVLKSLPDKKNIGETCSCTFDHSTPEQGLLMPCEDSRAPGRVRSEVPHGFVPTGI